MTLSRNRISSPKQNFSVFSLVFSQTLILLSTHNEHFSHMNINSQLWIWLICWLVKLLSIWFEYTSLYMIEIWQVLIVCTHQTHQWIHLFVVSKKFFVYTHIHAQFHHKWEAIHFMWYHRLHCYKVYTCGKIYHKWEFMWLHYYKVIALSHVTSAHTLGPQIGYFHPLKWIPVPTTIYSCSLCSI